MFQLTWQDATAWRSHAGTAPIPPGPADPAVDRAGIFYWEEHCVECSAPQCYSACQLFVARRDGRCARFLYGILPNPDVSGLFAYGADISFRRWAKLETKWPARPAMKSVHQVRFQGKWVNRVEHLTGKLVPLAQRLWPQKRFSGNCTHVRRNVIRGLSTAPKSHTVTPDALYVKCFSPETQTIRIQLELVTTAPVFRTSLTIHPGWNEHVIDAAELLDRAAGLPGRLQLSIENDLQVRLIFTWLDLVCFSETSPRRKKSPTDLARSGSGLHQIRHQSTSTAASTAVASSTTMVAVDSSTNSAPASDTSPPVSAAPASVKPAAKVKCVAWDLDNTLWSGVIGDAGPDGVTASPVILNMIRQLDERGILQTVVSKNEHAVAWKKIEQLNLADYFLYPAIHWGPKSRSVEQIAGELNINVDTFAVIDDSSFERAEIVSSLPQVRVFDPAEGVSILQRLEFDVPVTAESKIRRQSYLTEARRRTVSQSWRGDYSDFLRSCNMVLQIRRPQPDDRPRCLELIQRSNQFNLSGKRYTPDEFDRLLESSSDESFCIEVSDSFGGYGIVGFASFHNDPRDPQLTEFVLSCRVAQKMVEPTFLLWYAARLHRRGVTHLSALLNVTDRNKPLQDVLKSLQFERVAQQGNQQLLRMTFEDHPKVPDVISLDDGTLSEHNSGDRTSCETHGDGFDGGRAGCDALQAIPLRSHTDFRSNDFPAISSERKAA